MFICPSCETENRPGAKFCRNCGEARAGEATAAETAAVAFETASLASNDETVSAIAHAPVAVIEVEEIAEEPVVELSETPVTDSTADHFEYEILEEITEEELVAELKQSNGNGHSNSEDIELKVEERPEVMTVDDVEPVPTERPRSKRPMCPSCASFVRMLDKFCITCGERQPQRVPPEMKSCGECRTQLPLSANFCFVCGNDVGLHGSHKVRSTGELFSVDDPELFPTFDA